MRKPTFTYFILIGLIVIAICFGVLYGIYNYTIKQQETNEVVIENSEKIKGNTGSDLAVVIGKDTVGKKLHFKSILKNKRYSLYFDGTTNILNQYGEGMSAAELAIGDTVDISFSGNNNKALEITVPSDSWSIGAITKFNFDEKKKTMLVAGEEYRYTDELVISSNDAIINIEDINEQDTLTIKGKEKQLYSIVVNKGHGYIKLVNDVYFTGGWIEVGQRVIKPVTEDMMLVVPEGKYDVRITNKGNIGTAAITVRRDEETELDITQIDVQEVKKGNVEFSVTPDTAVLSIDGEVQDYSELVELTYGIHELKVEADGYITIKGNIKVGQALANIEIEMEEEEKKDNESSSSSDSSEDSSTSGESLESSTTSGSSSSSSAWQYDGDSSSNSYSDSAQDEYIPISGKIYIDGPSGAEVYMDGTYMGIAPINFKKVIGGHTITLRQNGFQTRSYSVTVENDGADVTYSFSALLSE